MSDEPKLRIVSPLEHVEDEPEDDGEVVVDEEVVGVLREALEAAEAGLVEGVILIHKHQSEPCVAGDWERREVLGFLVEAQMWAMGHMLTADFEVGDEEDE